MWVIERREKIEKYEESLLSAHYKHISKEIRFAKRQQMAATYYLILLYGGIAAIHIKYPLIMNHFVIITVLALILVLGLFFVTSCNNSIRSHIAMLLYIDNVYFPFYDKMIAALTNENKLRPTYSRMVDLFYYFVHFIVFIFTYLVILKHD